MNKQNYFECDNLKGAVNSGQEIIVKFTFNHPKGDPILKGIGALKGIGQWVESLWELKLTGGYVEPGVADLQVIEVLLRAYVEQI